MKPDVRFVSALIFLSLAACGPGRDPAQVSSGLTSYPAPERSSEFLQVTDEYGPLYLREGVYDSESPKRNWAGYWFPLRDSYLFRPKSSSELAPLQKYDLYARSRGIRTNAADMERTNPDLYDPEAQKWNGRCDAWAIASTVEPEPTHDRVLNGITFTVADQKALLISTYERVDVKTFGQPFNGNAQSDFQDIYPDQFHRFIQAEMFEKNHPFVIDTDPGAEIWNQPIWGVHSEVIRDSVDPRIFHVTTSLTGTKMILRIDGPGAESPDGLPKIGKPRPPISFTYTYDLFGDIRPDGSLLVTYGRWTGLSHEVHPDFVTAIPDHVRRNTLNRDLSIDLVDEILGHASI